MVSNTVQRIPAFVGFFLVSPNRHQMSLDLLPPGIHWTCWNVLTLINGFLLFFGYEKLGMIAFPFVSFCLIVGTSFTEDVNYTTKAFFGTIWTVYFLSFIYLCSRVSASYAVIMITLTELSDTFQFVWGKLFGKRHPFPILTPGKTVEGYIGGFITAIAAGLVICSRWLTLPTFTPLSAELFGVHRLILYFCFGLIATFGGAFGGLMLSSVKRRFDVKDAGFLLPGHGGFLDRLDGVLAVGPLAYAFVSALTAHA